MKIEKGDYTKYLSINGAKSIDSAQSEAVKNGEADYYIIYDGSEVRDSFVIFKKNDNWATLNRDILKEEEFIKVLFKYLEKYHEYITVNISEEEKETIKLCEGLGFNQINTEIQKGKNGEEYKYLIFKKELKNEHGLVPIDVIREKVEGYVKENFGLETPIFDPIFREENGKYYLGYMIVDFVDEKKEDFRFKRPTKWLLVDIVTGDLVNCFDSNKHDYIDKDKFPFNLVFDNYGNSALFDSSNYVLSSYFDWKKQVIKEMKEKFSNNNLFIDPKILRLENETISPNDFVLANVESILEDFHNEIMEKLGNKVGELYKDYYVYIIDLIRKHYVISGDINRTLLSSYVELIKYLWPDFIDIINSFDNIEHFNDPNFENALRKLIQDKTEKIKKNDDIVAKIDEKLKEVNPDYDPAKLKDMNRELNIDEQTPVDETIATLDKRIAELEGEEKSNYTVNDMIDKIDKKITELESEENKQNVKSDNKNI